MTVRFACIGALLAVALLAFAGCSLQNAPAPEQDPNAGRWPALNSELSYVWSAEPGIDLLDGPAVVVRAYLESVMIAGEAGSEDLLYPGFRRAVANEADAEPGSLPLWPVTERPQKMPRVGSMREHILRVTDKGPNVEAVVCHWTWGMATLQENGTYWSGEDNAGPDAGVSTMRFTLARPADPESSLPPQRGPSKYPFDDVFGDWRVIGKLIEGQSILSRYNQYWPDFQQDRDACITQAPEPAERRQFLKGGQHPRSDFPTLPPYPGWPLPTQ